MRKTEVLYFLSDEGQQQAEGGRCCEKSFEYLNQTDFLRFI